MRWPQIWWSLLLLLLAACAGQPASEAEPSHASKCQAVEFIAMASPESLPEGDELLLRVADVGAGLCVIGVGPDDWAFLVGADHWQGGRCAAAADSLIPDVGLALAVLSHNDSDHLGDFPEIVATREVDTVICTGRVPLECRDGLDAPCPATYRAFVGALGDLAGNGTTSSASRTPRLCPAPATFSAISRYSSSPAGTSLRGSTS